MVTNEEAKDMIKKVGLFFKRELDRQGLTQKVGSMLVGMTEESMSRWVRGLQVPEADNFLMAYSLLKDLTTLPDKNFGTFGRGKDSAKTAYDTVRFQLRPDTYIEEYDSKGVPADNPVEGANTGEQEL